MADQGNETRLTLRIETKGDPSAARKAGEADARAYGEGFARAQQGAAAPGKQPLLLPAISDSTLQSEARKLVRRQNAALRSAQTSAPPVINAPAYNYQNSTAYQNLLRMQENMRQTEIAKAQRMAAATPPAPPTPPRPVTPFIFAGGGGGGGGGGGRGPDITETTRALGQASRNVRAITGNPFEVLSTFSQSLTGVRKLRVALDQVAIDLQNLSTAYRNEKDATKRASLKKQINEKKAEAAGLVSQTQGVGFKARAVADFAVGNFITTGFLFTGFTIMQQAFTATATEVVRFAQNIVDPSNEARSAILSFAETLKSAGGSAQLQKDLNLSPNSKLSIFANTVEMAMTASQRLELFGQSLSAMGISAGGTPSLTKESIDALVNGLRDIGTSSLIGPLRTPREQLQGLSREQTAIKSQELITSAINTLEDPNMRAALMKVAQDTIAAQGSAVMQQAGAGNNWLNTSPQDYYLGIVDAIEKGMRGEGFNRAWTSAIAAQETTAGVASLKSILIGGGITGQGLELTPLQKAERNLARAQSAMAGASAAMQIREAERKVGQAGVAGAGDTIFDVAQRIINAQGEADKVKQQAAMQNNIARLTNKVATEKTVEDSLKALQAIKDDAATLGGDVAKALGEQLIKIKVEGADDRISKGLADLIQYVLNLSSKSGSTLPGSRPGGNP